MKTAFKHKSSMSGSRKVQPIRHRCFCLPHGDYVGLPVRVLVHYARFETQLQWLELLHTGDNVTMYVLILRCIVIVRMTRDYIFIIAETEEDSESQKNTTIVIIVVVTFIAVLGSFVVILFMKLSNR